MPIDTTPLGGGYRGTLYNDPLVEAARLRDMATYMDSAPRPPRLNPEDRVRALFGMDPGIQSGFDPLAAFIQYIGHDPNQLIPVRS